MDGFYIAYVTGRAGNSVILLAIRGTILSGVDAGGLKYDGEIVSVEDGFKCSVVYIVPAGSTLITGSAPATEDLRVPLEFKLPKDFAKGVIVSITTPCGPVNAKFEKLRDF